MFIELLEHKILDEPQNHAEKRITDTKEYIVHDTIYMKLEEIHIPSLEIE